MAHAPDQGIERSARQRALMLTKLTAHCCKYVRGIPVPCMRTWRMRWNACTQRKPAIERKKAATVCKKPEKLLSGIGLYVPIICKQSEQNDCRTHDKIKVHCGRFFGKTQNKRNGQQRRTDNAFDPAMQRKGQ